MIRALALAALLAFGSQAAADCRNVTFEGEDYAVCAVDMATADLRLFLNDGNGDRLGQFGAVDAMLAGEGKRLAFAMNAGMYHADRAPVGLYIENGQEIAPLVPGAGPGNFGMVPNGVLCLRPGRADVIETRAFAKRRPACTFATQSGPMLVIGGKLHPRFLPDSDSRYVRNGVGTNEDGSRAFFAISRRAVTFHTFARLFRDHLGTPDALYLDGSVSRLYAPDLGRSDLGFALGPMVGLVVAE